MCASLHVNHTGAEMAMIRLRMSTRRRFELRFFRPFGTHDKICAVVVLGWRRPLTG